MIGNNTLELNEATIIEAVQEYLVKRWNPPEACPLVKSVRPSNGRNINIFTVEIQNGKKTDCPAS